MSRYSDEEVTPYSDAETEIYDVEEFRKEMDADDKSANGWYSWYLVDFSGKINGIQNEFLKKSLSFYKVIQVQLEKKTCLYVCILNNRPKKPKKHVIEFWLRCLLEKDDRKRHRFKVYAVRSNCRCKICRILRTFYSPKSYITTRSLRRRSLADSESNLVSNLEQYSNNFDFTKDRKHCKLLR